jgi:hypothetical protein
MCIENNCTFCLEAKSTKKFKSAQRRMTAASCCNFLVRAWPSALTKSGRPVFSPACSVLYLFTFIKNFHSQGAENAVPAFGCTSAVGQTLIRDSTSTKIKFQTTPGPSINPYYRVICVPLYLCPHGRSYTGKHNATTPVLKKDFQENI